MRLLDGRPPWWLCWREGQELSGWRRLRFPPRGAAAGLVCAVLTLPSALTASCTPPSTSSTRELLVVGSVGPSLPDRVGLLGFQEPGGILPVSCLEKQGADCGPPCLRSRVGCGSSPAAKDEGGSAGCLLLA